MSEKMLEEVKEIKEEDEFEEYVSILAHKEPERSIAIVINNENEIQVNVNGLDMDTAYIVMLKAAAKFRKAYDNYLLTQND